MAWRGFKIPPNRFPGARVERDTLNVNTLSGKEPALMVGDSISSPLRFVYRSACSTIRQRIQVLIVRQTVYRFVIGKREPDTLAPKCAPVEWLSECLFIRDNQVAHKV